MARRRMSRRRAWVTRAIAAATLVATVTVYPGTPARAADLPAATIAHDWTFAGQRLAATTNSLAATAYPRNTTSTGTWQTVGASDWTSGFFPGLLWLMYERTSDPVWRTRALNWQNGLESQKTNAVNHDVGFKMFTSFGNGYRLTATESYRQVLLTSAATLASRYDPEVRMTRSLGSMTDTTNMRVIIDNLMNLELLWWAADHGGDPAWRTMATNHALRSITDFQRADGSVYHLVNYDPTTGAVRSKGTIQGYDTESSWSRGQAWAIAGWTLAYRYTGDTRFLDAAERAADYYIGHLPSDKVPYWDFELPTFTGEPRDSSAAAIASSGLLELASFETDLAPRLIYFAAARDSLASLSSPAYLSEGTTNRAILLHGTRHKPAGSYDHGLIFGDYYFLEALERYEELTGSPTTTTTTTTSTSTTSTSTTSTSTTTTSPTAPTFSLAVAPTSSTVARGQTATFTVTVTPQGGFDTPVRLQATGVPNYSTVTFTPPTTLSTSTFKVATSSSTPRGARTMTLKGVSSGITKTIDVPITVT
jgi:unsaturated chondroitin disaccharide hydrolase